MTKQQHYKAALYCRLSVDDGNFGGSVSIDTQKVLLEQYCKDHSITEYTFYPYNMSIIFLLEEMKDIFSDNENDAYYKFQKPERLSNGL